ncbi:MAG: MerR family transcriptional regulator [Clostridium sp.]|uniref:MerR family transcriptional regulator n=1 Tax=Clostridium sp. TaxID=1506 RepID=UPI003F3D49F2
MKLSIGEVSKIFKISKDTLRYYDKIDILNPEVNENNKYRFYDLKDLEQLGLIVGIKSLGVSLLDIKSTIEGGDINRYIDLIQTQKVLIENKQKELEKLKCLLSNSEDVLKQVLNFKNEYNFRNLNLTKKEYTLYGVDIKNVLTYKNNTSDINTEIEKNLIYLKDTQYLYYFNINKNQAIEEEGNLIFFKENEKIKLYIENHSSIKMNQIFRKKISGNFINVNFYGSSNQIEKYIIDLNKYFNSNKSSYALIKYDFYLPQKDNDDKYFVNIDIEIN